MISSAAISKVQASRRPLRLPSYLLRARGGVSGAGLLRLRHLIRKKSARRHQRRSARVTPYFKVVNTANRYRSKYEF